MFVNFCLEFVTFRRYYCMVKQMVMMIMIVDRRITMKDERLNRCDNRDDVINIELLANRV